MYVCSEHFLPGDFTSFNKSLTEGSSTGKPRQRIKKIAIPSVNLPKSSHENTKCERRILMEIQQINTKNQIGQDVSTLTKPIDQLEDQSKITDEMELETIIGSQLGNDVISEMDIEVEKTENQSVSNEALIELPKPTEKTKPIDQLQDQSEITDEMELETIIESQLGNDVNIEMNIEVEKTENQSMRHDTLIELPKSTEISQVIFQLPQILNTNEKLKTFTGVDYTILRACKMCMENTASYNNINPTNIEFSIILVLCKLKTNLSFSCLSLLFGISKSTCTRMFYSTIHLLAVSIKSVIHWPTKEQIVENLPKCFHRFKNTRVVLDCTEVKVQKLKCLKCRILSYSHYKRTHTAEFLIGITPSGLISFVSKAYGGRATDKAIFNKENLIQKFQLNDGMMVDKGVLIEKECEENFLKLIRPPFLRKKKQLTKEDAKLTAEIARARVHVERAIKKIKNFAILKDQIDWYMIPYLNDIMIIVAATVNMKTPILGDDKF